MRGDKRDASFFSKLKDERQLNDWYNRTKAWARSQFVDEIFDIKYKPGSIDEINLFDLKKIFIYAVFTNTHLTDKRKYLVSQHEGDYNAHTIYKELLAHILTSTKASLQSSTILTYVATANFGTGAWNGSSELCILHWQTQVSEYEKLVQNTDKFSNTIKKSML